VEKKWFWPPGSQRRAEYQPGKRDTEKTARKRTHSPSFRQRKGLRTCGVAPSGFKMQSKRAFGLAITQSVDCCYPEEATVSARLPKPPRREIKNSEHEPETLVDVQQGKGKENVSRKPIGLIAALDLRHHGSWAND